MLTWELIEKAKKFAEFEKNGISQLSISQQTKLNFERASFLSDELYYPPNEISGDTTRFEYPKAYKVEVFPTQIVSLNDVSIIGWRSVINEQFFITDEAAGHSAVTRIIKENTSGYFEGFILNSTDSKANQHEINLVRDSRATEKFLGASFFVSALEPTNYGSFLLRTLPKLVDFKLSQLIVDRLVFGSNQKWVHDFLEIFEIQKEVIFLDEYPGELHFEKLHFPFSRYNEGFISQDLNKNIRKFTTKIPKADLKRIFVSRLKRNQGAPTYRPLVNELEIIDFLEKKYGFVHINLEEYTVYDQIKIMKGAEVVIGPSGSGMLNTMFCDPGTVVLEFESFTHCIRQHARLYSSSKLKYGVIFGAFDSSDQRDPVVRKWSVDLESIEQTLNKLLG